MVQILSIIICRITPKYFLNCVIIILPPIEKKKKRAEKTAIIYGNGQSQSDHYTGQKLLLNKTKEFTTKNLSNIVFKPDLVKLKPDLVTGLV
jgi:hypothetical protein